MQTPAQYSFSDGRHLLSQLANKIITTTKVVVMLIYFRSCSLILLGAVPSYRLKALDMVRALEKPTASAMSLRLISVFINSLAAHSFAFIRIA